MVPVLPLIVLMVIAFNCYSCEILSEVKSDNNGILTLTVNSIEKAISENEFVFVKLFDSSWCDNSLYDALDYDCALNSEFRIGAKILSETASKIKFAEIDFLLKFKDLSLKYEIILPPMTFVLCYNRNFMINYSGGGTSQEMVAWLESITKILSNSKYQHLDELVKAVKDEPFTSAPTDKDFIQIERFVIEDVGPFDSFDKSFRDIKLEEIPVIVEYDTKHDWKLLKLWIILGSTLLMGCLLYICKYCCK